MRLFTAIALPDEIKKSLEKYSLTISEKAESGNYSSAKNYHITLNFLGNVDNNRIPEINKIINTVARNFPPFDLTIEGVGHFKKKARKILYFNICDNLELLSEMQLSLYEKLVSQNLCAQQENYVPHLTFARQVKIRNIPETDLKVPILAEGITLYHSTRIDGELTYEPIYYRPLTGIATLDRVEDKKAVLETQKGTNFTLREELLPKGVSSGQKMSYNGLEFLVDNKKSLKEFDRIKNKFDKEKRKR